MGFAEFIELLVLCACWRAPPQRTLDSAHVLSAVRQLLDTLLARARRVDVLGFRYACYASAPLLEVRVRVEVGVRIRDKERVRVRVRVRVTPTPTPTP